MDTESLNTFIVLAKNHNFTQTARELFVAQSTVTSRIKELESELKLKLFLRTNRCVELTFAGEQFLAYAEKVLKLTEVTLGEISSSAKFDNTLRIGSADSIYESHLLPLILAYKKEHPRDALRISIGLSTGLIEQLQSGLLDVIYTYLPMSNSQFRCTLFREDTMVLVTDHKNLTYQDGISKEQLHEINYIMCNFALQNVGQFIRGLFPKYHQFSLEIDDCSKVLPFLIGQDCYSFLPADMAEPFIEDKTLRSIPLLDFKTPVITSYQIGNPAKEKLWSLLDKK